MTLIERLEAIGFKNLFTYRIGPCFQCEEIKQTFYLPELHRWLCEECYYHDSENEAFISELELQAVGKNMAQISMEQMYAELQALKAENQKLKSSREDNVFVGNTDNLTLKHRKINPKGWGVPTKWSNGQGYFRCSDFPFSFAVKPDNTAIQVFTEIPVDARQAQLFRDRFLNQQVVVAKRRQSANDGEATPQVPQAPSAPAVASSPTPQSTGPRSFSSLPEAERSSLLAKAEKAFEIPGLFKDKLSALKSVLPTDVTLP